MTQTTPDGTRAIVEVLQPGFISGWVEVPVNAPAPKVELFVDDLRVDSTFAVDAGERHCDGDVRVFRFALDDLWTFVGPANRLSVRLAGRALPVAGHGMFGVPDAAGPRTLDDLRRRLEVGEVFSRTGALQLSKSLDAAWQGAVLTLYGRLRAELTAAADYEPFFAYGTLLGAIRENGFIGHDLDFDCAFVSRHHDAAAAARDLQQIAFALIDHGYAARATPTHLQVADPAEPGVRINLFHLYFDEDAALQFPHGIAGVGRLDQSTWGGVREADFNGTTVLVPADAEAVLEHVYGQTWRSPNPGFSWSRDRTAQAVDGFLPPPAVEEVYWADFYARTIYTSGSSFFELVNARPDLPATVVDIGCGDGRDSYAFAGAGRTKVTGLDRSHVGVRQATKKAEQLGYGGTLSFIACDVGDAEKLRATLRAARTGDEPMAFYARFFLHSIPEDIQRVLMGVVAECARPGDYFAAEFRTDKDEAIQKVHGNHYRRFQNGPAFGRSLRETFGFTALLEQEGNGFSPYKGEDPQLYRVIARRA
jgi:ubiquinone/menaquinone biosynthesis C-methylase UbiE